MSAFRKLPGTRNVDLRLYGPQLLKVGPENITDEDYLRVGGKKAFEFFNKYKTALGSFRALKKYGKGDLVSTVDAKLDKIDKKKITRGDIVSVNTNEGIALGIYTGNKIAVVSLDGLIFLSLDDAIDCWRI